jgi:hypothetical protein
MASNPTLSATLHSKMFSDHYDNRIVVPSMVIVEAYTYYLLKVPLNVTLSYWPTAVRGKYVAQREFPFREMHIINISLNMCCSIFQKK